VDGGKNNQKGEKGFLFQIKSFKKMKKRQIISSRG
jgi:hypothetical protein